MNRRKKRMTMLCALYLLAALFFPVSAFAAEQSTQLSVTVPSSHSVRLEIEEHGSVEVEGKTYTGTQTIQVDRLKEETYTIQAEKGWKVAEVTYGPKGQADQIILEDSLFAAPAVNQDGNVLTVTVEKSSADTDVDKDTADTIDTSENKADSVNTGDETNPGFFMALLIESILTASNCIFSARKKKE